MIRLGLIGLGQAAQILHIPNIEKMENKFEITAVADISKNLTSYIADKYRAWKSFWKSSAGILTRLRWWDIAAGIMTAL